MTEPRQLDARQRKMVEDAVPRTLDMLRGLRRRVPPAQQQDLESIALEALSESALRFDPTEGVPFAAFAWYRVRGAVIDAVRRANPEMRRHRRALKVLETTQSILEESAAEHGPRPGMDRRTLEERVAAAAQLVERTAAAVWLSRSVDLPHAGETAADDPMPDEVAAHALDTAALRDALAACSEETRELLTAIYRDDRSMSQLARARGVATSTISRQHSRAIDDLRQRLLRDSPDS
jgi:RNA polymerase sigma factor for flagellar operon FliA